MFQPATGERDSLSGSVGSSPSAPLVPFGMSSSSALTGDRRLLPFQQPLYGAPLDTLKEEHFNGGALMRSLTGELSLDGFSEREQMFGSFVEDGQPTSLPPSMSANASQPLDSLHEVTEEELRGGYLARSVIAPGVYYVGVVDILQGWTVAKQAERYTAFTVSIMCYYILHTMACYLSFAVLLSSCLLLRLVKTYVLGRPADGISCMPPEPYKLRFQNKVGTLCVGGNLL